MPPKGKTVMGKHCACLLDKLDEKVCGKISGLAKKKTLFHQGNTSFAFTMGKLRDLKYKLLEHPAYFPDLTLLNVYL